jgi:hypothetical protein
MCGGGAPVHCRSHQQWLVIGFFFFASMLEILKEARVAFSDFTTGLVKTNLLGRQGCFLLIYFLLSYFRFKWIARIKSDMNCLEVTFNIMFFRHCNATGTQQTKTFIFKIDEII